MSNPDLLNPEAGQSALQVPQLQAKTAPLPTTFTEEKFYYCTVPSASFHRKDGKRLGFVGQFYKTAIKEDQDYLDEEIRNGNQYVAHATTQQIEVFRMRTEPKVVIREQVEAEIREDLEKQIRAQMEQEFAVREATLRSQFEPGSPNAANADANKLAGTDAQSAIDKLKSMRVGNATVTLDQQPNNPGFQGSIGSTADVTNAKQS